MKKLKISVILFFIITLLSSVIMAASSRVFSNSNRTYANSSATLANRGLASLGYNTNIVSGQISKSTIMSWINSKSDNYAFYINTNGGVNTFYDSAYNSISPGEISGNWDFVFLDSSYSAANVNFANSFKINGYSNRAFLGWSKEVTDYNSYLFANSFWNSYLKSTSIRIAAVNAAGDVPGSGTTPIKFYGDPNYYGYAR